MGQRDCRQPNGTGLAMGIESSGVAQQVGKWLRWGTCVTGESRTRTVIKLAPARLRWAHHQAGSRAPVNAMLRVSLALLPLLLPSHCRPHPLP
jgi:hypothetical protein